MTDKDLRENSIETELLLTKAEAIALVKRSAREKGAQWMLMVPLDAGVIDEPNKVFSLGCYTSLTLSRASAEEVLGRMAVNVIEHKGARIRVRKTVTTGGVLDGRIQYMIH